MKPSQSASAWNLLFLVGLVSFVGLLGFHFLFPIRSTVKPVDADLKVIASVSKQAQDKTAALKKDTEKSMWDLNAERLGTRTLATLTDLTDRNRLKLSGFRIEKAPDVSGLQQATYVAVLEGPFPAVVNVLKALEDPDGKLVVNLFQVSSSDPDSDKVTATLSIVGFIPAPIKADPKVAANSGGAKS